MRLVYGIPRLGHMKRVVFRWKAGLVVTQDAQRSERGDVGSWVLRFVDGARGIRVDML